MSHVKDKVIEAMTAELVQKDELIERLKTDNYDLSTSASMSDGVVAPLKLEIKQKDAEIKELVDTAEDMLDELNRGSWVDVRGHEAQNNATVRKLFSLLAKHKGLQS